LLEYLNDTSLQGKTAELRFLPGQTLYSSETHYKAKSGVHTASNMMGTAALTMGTRRLERGSVTPTYCRRLKCLSCLHHSRTEEEKKR